MKIYSSNIYRLLKRETFWFVNYEIGSPQSATPYKVMDVNCFFIAEYNQRSW